MADETEMLEGEVYRMIGDDGLRGLVKAFYRRVPGDDILGRMYPPADLAGAEERLAAFLIQRFGGPSTYSEKRGHPRLRMRHAPFVVNEAARDRWIVLMTAALDEVELVPPVRRVLERYFDDTATSMINSVG